VRWPSISKTWMPFAVRMDTQLHWEAFQECGVAAPPPPPPVEVYSLALDNPLVCGGELLLV